MGITCDATLSAFARLAGRPVEEAASPTPVLAARPAPPGPTAARPGSRSAASTRRSRPTRRTSSSRCGCARPAGRRPRRPPRRCTHLGSASYVARSARSRFNGGFGRGYVLRRYGAVTPRAALTEAIAVAGDTLTQRDLAARAAGSRAGAPALARAARYPRRRVDASLTLRDSLALRRPTAKGARPLKVRRAPAWPAAATLADGVHRRRPDARARPATFDVAICPTCASGTTFPLRRARRARRALSRRLRPVRGDRRRARPGAISKAIRARQGRLALSRFPLGAIAARPPGRGLDVGCGRGDLAAEFVDRGWTMVGVEPSPNACDAARARGVDARVGTLATVELEPGAYDMIVFQHSLEHTLDPRGRPGEGARRARSRRAARGHRPELRQLAGASLPRPLVPPRPAAPPHALHPRAGSRGCSPPTRAWRCSRSARRPAPSVSPRTIQYRLAGRCLFPGGLKLRVAAGLCVLTLPLARLARPRRRRPAAPACAPHPVLDSARDE